MKVKIYLISKLILLCSSHNDAKVRPPPSSLMSERDFWYSRSELVSSPSSTPVTLMKYDSPTFSFPLQVLYVSQYVSQCVYVCMYVSIYLYVQVVYVWLRGLILWPDREALKKTIPQSCQHSFGKKVAVILDRFEVFIERPSNLCARACTWSNYKHHNTAQVLLGITP